MHIQLLILAKNLEDDLMSNLSSKNKFSNQKQLQDLLNLKGRI